MGGRFGEYEYVCTKDQAADTYKKLVKLYGEKAIDEVTKKSKPDEVTYKVDHGYLTVGNLLPVKPDPNTLKKYQVDKKFQEQVDGWIQWREESTREICCFFKIDALVSIGVWEKTLAANSSVKRMLYLKEHGGFLCLTEKRLHFFPTDNVTWRNNQPYFTIHLHEGIRGSCGYCKHNCGDSEIYNSTLNEFFKRWKKNNFEGEMIPTHQSVDATQ